jgi:hypothetical protein
MALSVSLALFAGMLAGLWFRIFIFTPVIALALVGVIGAGRARADDAWSIGLTAIGVTIALPIGYLIGSGLRVYWITRKAAGLAQSPPQLAPTGRRRFSPSPTK